MREVRPIDANALLDEAYGIYVHGSPEFKTRMSTFKALIDDAPTIDYAPVGRGQWEDGAFENSKRCTECGRYSSKIFTYREAVFDYLFCPYCGKKCGEAKTHEQR